MELCEGGDLGAIIKRCRRTRTHLPEDTVWAYFAQMTAALEACHYRAPANTAVGTTRVSAHAILHRDLKPENVFLDVDQNVKLGDFGLSKQIAAQTFANTYVGTPYYMSPELASGQQYDIKSDIWALGCIVYELCALSPPFDANNQAELTRKIKQGMVPSLPRQYSRDLQDTVNAMLHLDHRRRPTTRQLLQVRHIKWACRTHELAALHRKVQLDKEQVVAQTRALEAKEDELAAREKAVAESEAAHSQGDVLGERAKLLDERQLALEQQHVELAQREEACKAFHAELVQQYETWYNGERVQMHSALAEKDALLAQLQEQLAEKEHEQQRRTSDSVAMPGRLPTRHAPRMQRRVSRGRETDEDLRTRIAGVSFSTPRKQAADLVVSDEWEDQEAEEPVPMLPALARLKRLEPKADISDCSMKDASTIWRIPGAAEEASNSPIPQKLLAALHSPAPHKLAAEPAKPKRVSLPEESAEAEDAAESLPASRTVPDLPCLAQDPQWHLCSEEEKPSPFLKRVSRVPLDVLSKPAYDDDAPDAQLVPGPAKLAAAAPFAHDQENQPVMRARKSFAEQRKRRSSLLRPPDAREPRVREASRVPVPRPHIPPASPMGRVGAHGRPQISANLSPRAPRARLAKAT